jgi:signal transduction histidine kinase
MARARSNHASRNSATLLAEEPAAAPASAAPAAHPDERRRFMSMLAHEVRAPLAAIKSYSDILLGYPPADEESRRSFLKAIADETARIDRLLDDVTEIEKLECGTSPYVPTWCDLGAMVERAALTAHPLATVKKVAIGVETVGEPGLVPGEPQQLQRAVTQLVENAVKFSLPGGKVHARLVAWEGADSVTVEVEDEGIGIPDAARERIYEKFFQASVPPDEVSPRGSGLGLTLVRLIAVRHGGAIAHTARPQGSAFTLTLRRGGLTPP